MRLDVEFLSPDATRAALIADLLKENAKARRLMAVDHLGRPNAEWAEVHAFMNTLITLLED